MSIDTIIDLDNNLHYLLLDTTNIEDRKFFYAVGVKDDMSDVTDEYIFLEELNRDGKTFVKKVQDKEINDFLLTVFTMNYMDYVNKINNGEEEF